MGKKLSLRVPTKDGVRPRRLGCCLQANSVAVRVVSRGMHRVLRALLTFKFQRARRPSARVPLGGPRYTRATLGITDRNLMLLGGAGRVLPVHSNGIGAVTMMNGGTRKCIYKNNDNRMRPFRCMSMLSNVHGRTTRENVQMRCLSMCSCLPTVVFASAREGRGNFHTRCFSGVGLRNAPGIRRARAGVGCS